MSRWRWMTVWVAALAALAPSAWAQTTRPATTPAQTAPATQATPATQPELAPADLRPLLAERQSEMAIVRLRYESDRRVLTQFYDVSSSPTRRARLLRFDRQWLAALERLDGSTLGAEAKADRTRLITAIKTLIQESSDGARAQARIAPLVPFAPALTALEEAWRRMEPVDGMKSAEALETSIRQIAEARDAVQKDAGRWPAGSFGVAADTVQGLRGNVRQWFNFYNGYDPLFTWWTAEPYKRLDKQLADYATFLKSHVSGGASTAPASRPDDAPIPDAAPVGEPNDVPDLGELLAFPRSEMRAVFDRYRPARRGGRRSDEFYKSWLDALDGLEFAKLSREAQVDCLLLKNLVRHDRAALHLPRERVERPKDDSGIRGTPIGRAALANDLAGEMIPYTPEELIAIATKEFAWCDAEMNKASHELGFGDDWKRALELAKSHHVEPGKQPLLIRDLIGDSVQYVTSRGMVTVPALEVETLRATMLSPQQQLTSPFFLGGSFIQISYPTDTMPYAARLQSMRGNNVAFSRATVHHELIPGHNLQAFMQARYNAHRSLFGTPFWTEGWALYWEMRLYDGGFARTPEERVGFLFWRMHRCARIVFSLKFHLGEWSPQQCVDYLVERVGHERDNATAEVRRSFAGGYGPLYQAGYMLGALQFRQLQKELVGSGKMTDPQFHDAVLHENAMPVAMVRAALLGQPLSRDGIPPWKFYGERP